MIRLIEDWRKVLRYGWSIRLIVLAGLLSGLEIVLPMFGDVLPRKWFAALMFSITVAAFIARLTAQPKMKDRK